jgi:hypothetical protein
MAQKLSLKFNQSNFSDLVSKLKDLTGIEDVIKIKFDSDYMLLYSVLSNEQQVAALKTYAVKTKDYIDNFTNEETFDFIITSASKFVKNIQFFNTQSPIKFDIIYKPLPEDDTTMHIRSAQLSNGKLKISCIGGEEYKIREVNKSFIDIRLNPKNSRWSFKVSNQDFSDIKKLSSINSEEKTFNINVQDGKVTFNETSKWELEVDTITSKNQHLIFGKKYLSNINCDDEFVNFNIFDTFILIKDKESNLMLSFEQNFDIED